MQWEYKTRVVMLNRGNSYNDNVLRDEARAPSHEDAWEIFSVSSMGGDEYRLFMKRQKRSR